MKFNIYQSPWPILLAFNLGFTLLNLISGEFLVLSILNLTILIYFWFKDFYLENKRGQYGKLIFLSLKYAFGMFLITETMYFIALFWCILSNIFSSTLSSWPPYNIQIEDSLIPILGTILLIGSSISATSSHHYYRCGNLILSNILLIITILMGLSFIIFTGLEFYCNKFTISDGIYGSIIYMLLGTHLIHVILGLILLTLTPNGIPKEFAIYYWHFVDTIWLFVYVVIYLDISLWDNVIPISIIFFPFCRRSKLRNKNQKDSNRKITYTYENYLIISNKDRRKIHLALIFLQLIIQSWRRMPFFPYSRMLEFIESLEKVPQFYLAAKYILSFCERDWEFGVAPIETIVVRESYKDLYNKCIEKWKIKIHSNPQEEIEKSLDFIIESLNIVTVPQLISLFEIIYGFNSQLRAHFGYNEEKGTWIKRRKNKFYAINEFGKEEEINSLESEIFHDPNFQIFMILHNQAKIFSSPHIRERILYSEIILNFKSSNLEILLNKSFQIEASPEKMRKTFDILKNLENLKLFIDGDPKLSELKSKINSEKSYQIILKLKDNLYQMDTNIELKDLKFYEILPYKRTLKKFNFNDSVVIIFMNNKLAILHIPFDFKPLYPFYIIDYITSRDSFPQKILKNMTMKLNQISKEELYFKYDNFYATRTISNLISPMRKYYKIQNYYDWINLWSRYQLLIRKWLRYFLYGEIENPIEEILRCIKDQDYSIPSRIFLNCWQFHFQHRDIDIKIFKEKQHISLKKIQDLIDYKESIKDKRLCNVK